MIAWLKYLHFMLTATLPKQYSETGRSRLWCYFGLSRASFAVMPRVLMHEMPDAWQGKMADLLTEFSDTFPSMPAKYFVSIRGAKGFVKLPEWLCNYRRPDLATINQMRVDPVSRKILDSIPDV